MATEDEKALLARLDAQLDSQLTCDVKGCAAPARMQLLYICQPPGAILCEDHALLVQLQIDRDTARGAIWACQWHGGTWPLNVAVRVEVLEGLDD